MEKDYRIVMDIDGTLCGKKQCEQTYSDLKPNPKVLDKLLEYKKRGYYIILFTSRNMNTHNNNLGRINATTAKILFEWLDRFQVPYDEIHFGKPWCGFRGFYVDDKAIRPSELVTMNHEEIIELLKLEETKISEWENK